jgi:(1->4)-alpha-D-glucan 1-alpha-D-glucosylmutase
VSARLRATARLQLHKDFTLDEAIPLVPYFSDLGISHIYASPLLQSVEGSMHGYDTIDCAHIDPARGGTAGLDRLVAALRARDMGLILDIVPNHMGVAAGGNIWWDDVLAYGQQSRFANFFDINWLPPDPTLHGRVLLPFLGASLADTLAAGELTLRPSDTHGFVVHYGGRHYPICPEHHDEIRHVLRDDPTAFAPETEPGRTWLLALVDRQHYRLCSWRSGNALINWRRFFNVTSLAALRMEDDAVFEAAHAKVFELYERGLIDGIRADHVDGLTQPGAYCRKLHDRLEALRARRPDGLRDAPPIVYVEKILNRDEALPEAWPVTGTTGYEFLEDVSLVLHDPRGEGPVTTLWQSLSPQSFEALEHEARTEMLDDSFQTELGRLVGLCAEISRETACASDFTLPDIEAGLRAICLGFPTYRSYFADVPDARPPEAERALARATDAARDRTPSPRHAVIDWLRCVLDGTLAGLDAGRHHAIAAQFEHLTAPLAAKAGEDTAFYRYGRALSRVDVGGDPSVFSADVAAFHKTNIARRARTPDGMVTTATHDHKRGADTRARLAVLSEPAASWPETARQWFMEHASLRTGGPNQADAFCLYQSLIGAWPVNGIRDDVTRAALRERLQAFQTKALREAARRTTWNAPDSLYEAACARFLDLMIDDGPYAHAIEAYVGKIGAAGALNSLSQTLLRLTVPGVPDLYQGTEFWDLSLVDPDNRRPVDFAARREMLARDEMLAEAARHWSDGGVQQRLIATVLAFRRMQPDLFARGTYEPVIVEGPLAEHLIVFLRRSATMTMLVVAPRLTLGLQPAYDLTISDARFHETRLRLPDTDPVWQNLLTSDNDVDLADGALGYFDGALPLAVFTQHA